MKLKEGDLIKRVSKKTQNWSAFIFKIDEI